MIFTGQGGLSSDVGFLIKVGFENGFQTASFEKYENLLIFEGMTDWCLIQKIESVIIRFDRLKIGLSYSDRLITVISQRFD